MADSPSIDAYSKTEDWDTRYRSAPSSADGEFSRRGANSMVADRTALSFTETARSPYDGDESRSQGKFRTKDGGKNG